MSWFERLRGNAISEPQGSEVRFGRVLEGLVGKLRRLPHPHVLDLGYTCGANIDFFVRMGCKVHVDDYVAGLLSRPRSTPAPERAEGGRRGPVPVPRKAPAGLPPAVDHESGQFQAVLCWDLFDYVSQEDTDALAAEMRRVTAAGGYVFAFFGPSRPGEARSPVRFRIQGEGSLDAEEVRGPRVRPHHLANRDILRLFTGFDIAQTVLLKNGVREMLLHKRPLRPRPEALPHIPTVA